MDACRISVGTNRDATLQGVVARFSGSIAVALHPPPSALKSRTRSLDIAAARRE
jgi:hypothetical protein